MERVRWSLLPLRIGGDFVRRKIRRKGKRVVCESGLDVSTVLLVVQSK